MTGIEREYHYVAGLRLEGRSEADLTEIAMRTADLRGERIAELEAESNRLRMSRLAALATETPGEPR